MRYAFGMSCLSLLLLFALSAGGCSTAGREFNTANIANIKKGITTKPSVLDMFGAPFRTETSPNGEVWTYCYVRSNVTGAGVVGHAAGLFEQSKTCHDALTIVFDGDVVKDFSSNQSAHVDTYIGPGQ